VPAALREVLRVLKPGGRFVFAGEPTKLGDVYARKISQLTWWLTTNVTRLPALNAWRRPQAELDSSSRAAALESVVDLHTFDPKDLERMARAAGAHQVRAVTEELSAALFGWPVRTFEAAVPKGKLGFGWAMFAYRSWQRLSWLDEKVLARVMPRELFYNVLITGTRPTD
jgi:SAM-dependent methyltransferase